jgi:hypothetical protein
MDLGKTLENIDGILAFKGVKNGKILFQGGNQNYLFPEPIDGTRFSFPSVWHTRFVLNPDRQKPETLELALRLRPGPVLWGFFVLGAAWILGAAVCLGRLPAHGKTAPKDPSAFHSVSAGPHGRADVKLKRFSTPRSGSCFLVLDQHCFIRQASPFALEYLKKPESTLLGLHFLDINPDPAVMKAIGEKAEMEFQNPFPGLPALRLALENHPEGMVLVHNENKGPLLS